MLRNWQIVLFDTLLILLSIIFGLILRLEIIYVGFFIRAIWPFIILAILVRPLVFYTFGIYRRIWRYATTKDLITLAMAILTGSVILTAVTLIWLYPSFMATFPRSLLGIVLDRRFMSFPMVVMIPGYPIRSKIDLRPHRQGDDIVCAPHAGIDVL